MRLLRALLPAGALVLALPAGCAPIPMGYGLEPASFAGSFINEQDTAPESVPVRLDGLGFLRLGMSQADAIAAMAAHGYVCHGAAATRRYAPCTASPEAKPDSVVLELEGGLLTAIEIPILPRDGDARALLESTCDRMKRADFVAMLEEAPAGVAMRALPGDGSLLEMRWWSGTSRVMSAQRLLRRPGHAPILGGSTQFGARPDLRAPR